MYIPPAFREERLPVLHDMMRRSRLACLVSQGAVGLAANHLPVMLAAEEGAYGTLYGHVAKGNPEVTPDAAPQAALMIFTGADAYISPNWYPSKRETGKAVPTWNYVAVHAHGRLEPITEPSRLREIVSRLTDRFERERPEPWRVADAPADYLDAMLRGITGFRFVIERLEGKWKMSQNRSPEDRAGAIRGLRAEGTPEASAVADIMAERP